jgi:NAD(P)H-dependent nitrite reductase small subunit
MSGDWHAEASDDEVDEDEPKGVEIGETQIAIFKVGDDYFATGNVCPHAFAMLSDGFVEDGVVECPLHQAKFEVATGRCVAEPAEEDLKTFEVKVEDGQIHVRLPAG